jgi:hypothetical protein
MVHVEGFDAQTKEDTEKFIERLKELWETERSRPRGSQERYGLTIGIRNRRAIFEPTVTTGKGVLTLIIWNLRTEDIELIKKVANEIGLTPAICPYLWFEQPANLPGELPAESIEEKNKGC